MVESCREDGNAESLRVVEVELTSDHGEKGLDGHEHELLRLGWSQVE